MPIPSRIRVDDKSSDLDESLATAREKMARLRIEYQAATDLDERMERLNKWSVAINTYSNSGFS